MRRHAVVGLWATAVHCLVLVMLVESAGVAAGTLWLKLPYLVPQGAATALILAGGYALNRRWSFA
ncbi:MAG: hypothetical protein ACREGK_10460 [Geminicoccales bacterium]